jgi:hypothetical protein
MTARLARVLAAVEAQLAGVTFHTGAKYLAAQDSPPRIVWVPTRDAFGPATKGGTNPRPLRTRSAGVEAHVWGSDLEATETLVHQVVAALHRAAHGSYEVRQASWEQPEWLDRGELCVVALAVAIPVTDDPIPTATVDAVAPDASQETAGDGVLACGEE